MEIILVLSLAIGFAIPASVYGHDSRERLSSDEEQLAARGFTWAARPLGTPHPRRPRPG